MHCVWSSVAQDVLLQPSHCLELLFATLPSPQFLGEVLQEKWSSEAHSVIGHCWHCHVVLLAILPGPQSSAFVIQCVNSIFCQEDELQVREQLMHLYCFIYISLKVDIAYYT